MTRIFYPVDIQNDFMNKNGALNVPDAELIKPNIKFLTQYADENRIFVLGSVDNHFGAPEYKDRETELARWGGSFPDHCMDGTYGQMLIEESKLKDFEYAIYIDNQLDNKLNKKLLDRAVDHFDFVNINKHRPTGVYLEKQNYDVFTNPNTSELIKILGLNEAIVYGVATDYCVKVPVLRMQKLGIQCYVVEDAIKGVFQESTKSALEEMTKAGAKFLTTKEVLEGKI